MSDALDKAREAIMTALRTPALNEEDDVRAFTDAIEALIDAKLSALSAPETGDAGVTADITFGYMNWRGEHSERHARPIRIWYGSTEWHPTPQWFLHALDREKGEARDFALKDFEGYAARQRPAPVPDLGKVKEALRNARASILMGHKRLAIAEITTALATLESSDG